MRAIRMILLFALSAWMLQAEDKVLLVLTNHGQLGEKGTKTGFYLSEAAHPHEAFTEAGYRVDFASPAGGFAPVDPKSLKDPDPMSRAFLKRFISEHQGRQGVVETRSLETLDAAGYVGIFFAGGHGTMWDFPDSPGLQRVVMAIFERGGVIGAVCHGPAALLNLKLKDGSALVKGKRVCGFTNAEEEAVGLTKAMPFLLESRLKELGANFVGNPTNFAQQAVLDERLATGQNPASAHATAELMLEALKSK